MGMLSSEPSLLTLFCTFPRLDKNASTKSVIGKNNSKPSYSCSSVHTWIHTYFQLGTLLLWRQPCLQTSCVFSSQPQGAGREALGRWQSSPWQPEQTLTLPDPWQHTTQYSPEGNQMQCLARAYDLLKLVTPFQDHMRALLMLVWGHGGRRKVQLGLCGMEKATCQDGAPKSPHVLLRVRKMHEANRMWLLISSLPITKVLFQIWKRRGTLSW